MSQKQILGDEQIDVLRRIKTFSPEAIIAGGAVRDLIMEKPFRDVDIWVTLDVANPNTKKNWQCFVECDLPTLLELRSPDRVDPVYVQGIPTFMPPPLPRGEDIPVPPMAEGVQLQARRAGERARARPAEFRWDADPFVAVTPYRNMRQLGMVINIQRNGTEYQLIGVSGNPIEFVRKEFDIGFCQAWHDGDSVHTTKAFKEDRDTQTLTSRPTSLSNYDPESLERRFKKLEKKYPGFKRNIDLRRIEKEQKEYADLYARNFTATGVFR